LCRRRQNAKANRKTDCCSDDRQQHSLPQNQAEDIGGLRTKRHSQSNLARPADDDVRHHAVDADHRQQPREGAEQSGERRQEAYDGRIQA
jgi:hypothetical protein